MGNDCCGEDKDPVEVNTVRQVAQETGTIGFAKEPVHQDTLGIPRSLEKTPGAAQTPEPKCVQNCCSASAEEPAGGPVKLSKPESQKDSVAKDVKGKQNKKDTKEPATAATPDQIAPEFPAEQSGAADLAISPPGQADLTLPQTPQPFPDLNPLMTSPNLTLPSPKVKEEAEPTKKSTADEKVPEPEEPEKPAEEKVPEPEPQEPKKEMPPTAIPTLASKPPEEVPAQEPAKAVEKPPAAETNPPVEQQQSQRSLGAKKGGAPGSSNKKKPNRRQSKRNAQRSNMEPSDAKAWNGKAGGRKPRKGSNGNDKGTPQQAQQNKQTNAQDPAGKPLDGTAKKRKKRKNRKKKKNQQQQATA